MDQYKGWVIGTVIKPAETFRDINEKNPIGLAFVTYLVVSMLSNFALMLLDSDKAGITGALQSVKGAFGSIITVLIFVTLLHFIARLFSGGQGRFWNFCSCYLFAIIPLIFTVILVPFFSLFGLAGLFAGSVITLMLVAWTLVLDVIAIRESYSLTTLSSVLVMVIAIVIIIVIIFLYALIYVDLLSR